MNSKEIKLTITKSNLPASLKLVALEPKLAIALKIIGQTEKNNDCNMAGIKPDNILAPKTDCDTRS